MKQRDSSWKPRFPMGRIETSAAYGYDYGHVVTQFGYVRVYAQGGCNSKGSLHTSISLVLNGREYTRWYDRRYSKRGIVTLADRFAREIAKGRK